MNVVQQVASSVIRELVSQKESFTAYNVTEEVRDILFEEDVQHYRLKQYIHEVVDQYVQNGQYAKAQDFTKHANGPFVYSANLKVNPCKTIFANQPTSFTWTLPLNPKGRTTIPKKILDILLNNKNYTSNKKNQSVALIKANSATLLIKDQEHRTHDIGTIAIYCIDCHGNIKITNSIIYNFFGKDLKKVGMEVTPLDGIIITSM